MNEETPGCHWCDGMLKHGLELTEDGYFFCSERCLDEYGEDLELEDLKRFVYGDVGY